MRAQAVAPGAAGSFLVSVAQLIPNGESQPITIAVLDEDLWSDDTLLNVTWSQPQRPRRRLGPRSTSRRRRRGPIR